jgi:hypothetical protein
MLNTRRTSLFNRFTTWLRSHPLGSEESVYADIDEGNSDLIFEELRLPLPSNLDPTESTHLSDAEKQLRVGQAYDSLKQVRKTLALRLAMLRGTKQTRGQHENTRSQTAIKNITSDIKLIAARYNASYTALCNLGAQADYPDLRFLEASDLTTSHVFDIDKSLGRGREAREGSWIWRMQGVDVVTPDNNWLHEGEVKRPCA